MKRISTLSLLIAVSLATTAGPVVELPDLGGVFAAEIVSYHDLYDAVVSSPKLSVFGPPPDQFTSYSQDVAVIGTHQDSRAHLTLLMEDEFCSGDGDDIRIYSLTDAWGVRWPVGERCRYFHVDVSSDGEDWMYGLMIRETQESLFVFIDLPDDLTGLKYVRIRPRKGWIGVIAVQALHK